MASISRRKKYSIDSELRALFTLCHTDNAGSEMSAGVLLASLSSDHFVTPIGEKCFKRIRHLLKNRGEMPEIEDLFEDPGIDPETRRTLRMHYKEGMRGLRNPDKARKLLHRLETYRKLRALFMLGADLESALSEDKVDPDEVIAKMATDITNAASSERRFRVTSRGDGNSALKVAKKILNGNGPSFIPTGIKAFDSINNGIPRGAFMMLTTETSGGKSTLISQMAENFAMNGARVAVVPLEMDTEEMYLRDIARASGIDMNDLNAPKKKLSREQRNKAYKLFRRRTLDIDKRGGSVKVVEPGGDVDIYTLLNELKPHGFDVIMIDYVGLLKGADGERQWQELGNITRYCKIWAGLNKCVVIMAAQLSAEGIIRYSRTMEEHASYSWKWMKDDLFKETGIARIEQTKARQAKQFDFLLKFDMAHMHVRDVTREEETNYWDMSEELKKKGKRHKDSGNDNYKGKKKKSDNDNDDDEDDDDEPVMDRGKKSKGGGHGGGKWSPSYGGGKKKKAGGGRNRFEEEF